MPSRYGPLGPQGHQQNRDNRNCMCFCFGAHGGPRVCVPLLCRFRVSTFLVYNLGQPVAVPTRGANRSSGDPAACQLVHFRARKLYHLPTRRLSRSWGPVTYQRHLLRYDVASRFANFADIKTQSQSSDMLGLQIFEWPACVPQAHCRQLRSRKQGPRGSAPQGGAR